MVRCNLDYSNYASISNSVANDWLPILNDGLDVYNTEKGGHVLRIITVKKMHWRDIEILRKGTKFETPDFVDVLECQRSADLLGNQKCADCPFKVKCINMSVKTDMLVEKLIRKEAI